MIKETDKTDNNENAVQMLEDDYSWSPAGSLLMLGAFALLLFSLAYTGKDNREGALVKAECKNSCVVAQPKK